MDVNDLIRDPGSGVRDPGSGGRAIQRQSGAHRSGLSPLASTGLSDPGPRIPGPASIVSTDPQTEMVGHQLPRALLDAVIDDLSLSIVVLDDRRILYRNTSARVLAEKLQREHRTDLLVLLRDQADAAAAHLQATGRAVSLVTSGNGEPFYIHLREMVVDGVGRTLVACIREIAPERNAVKHCYKLSDREAQVVDLVLRGYGNRDIATALDIAPTTAKKHLSRIFNKVGVDSRAQL